VCAIPAGNARKRGARAQCHENAADPEDLGPRSTTILRLLIRMPSLPGEARFSSPRTLCAVHDARPNSPTPLQPFFKAAAPRVSQRTTIHGLFVNRMTLTPEGAPSPSISRCPAPGVRRFLHLKYRPSGGLFHLSRHRPRRSR